MILFWVRHAPYSTNYLAETIRAAAMTGALGTPVRLLFVGDGVRALVKGQEPFLKGPPVAKLLQGIVTDASPALIHRDSLAHRALDLDELVVGVPVTLVSTDEAADWIARSERVVPF